MVIFKTLNKLKLLIEALKFPQGTTKMGKNLAVFDFDHTVINDNSDVVAVNMLDPKKIPPEIKQLHRSDGWTAFMQGIFNLLHKNNIKKDAITAMIHNLKEVNGMSTLIKELHDNLDFDVIIISDSNSYFINAWLEAKKLNKYIFKVFTNPAYFDETGLLNISMYHLQTFCKLSTKNLCKGQIMEDFVKERSEEGISYEKIMYAGDGMNDFCPILRLRERDLACVRRGYKCVDIVTKSKEGSYKDEDGECRIVISDVLAWSTGFDILDYIKQSKT